MHGTMNIKIYFL